MFKKIHWKTFPQDFLVAQAGFILFGLAIALIIQANLGTGAWGVLVVALADYLGTSPGLMVILTGFIALGLALLLGEEVGWGTVANMLFIGPWLDFFMLFIPVVNDNLPLQVAMLLGSIAIVGLASPIYIGVNAGAGPRDSLMLAVSRICGWSVRRARVSIELVILSIGWLLGGPVGVGTLVFAILVGPSVQLGFKLLRVQPHHPGSEPSPRI
jgi:uncharacterized membrane protein YczE